MRPDPRVYLVGAHATGKTTVARWVRDAYGLPMISEVARTVLAEMETGVDRLRTDLELTGRYQSEVFARQIAAEEAQPGAFVSDRAFCNLAYAAQHSLLLPDIFADGRLQRYMDSVRKGVVFFLRPHRQLLVDDGVRESLDWEEVVRIDGMVKLMLEMFRIPYVPVEALSMQERVRTIGRVLDLAGFDAGEEPSSETRVAASEPLSEPVNGRGVRHEVLVPVGTGDRRRRVSQ